MTKTGRRKARKRRERSGQFRIFRVEKYQHTLCLPYRILGDARIPLPSQLVANLLSRNKVANSIILLPFTDHDSVCPETFPLEGIFCSLT